MTSNQKLRPKGVMCIYMGKSRQLNACEIYRGNMPLYWLGERSNWETGFSFYDLIHAGGRNMWQSLMEKADLFIFPRAFLPCHDDGSMAAGAFELFDLFRSAGKRVIYEVDDDFTNEHRHVVDGDAVTLMKWCDAITVTTPMLRRRMERITGRPTYVLPNMIDPAAFKAPREQLVGYDPAYTVVGLTGSSTHAGDWKVLSNVLPALLDKHPTMQLWLMGFHPDYLRGLERTWYINGMDYAKYVEVVKHFDIVLAPVDPNDGFNASKSPIKAIEGMGVGAAVVATNMPVYRLAIFDDQTGLLVEHTEEDWFAALDNLLTDVDRRKRLAAAGNKWVWKHHNIQTGWTQWSKAYHQILKQQPFRPKTPDFSKEAVQ